MSEDCMHGHNSQSEETYFYKETCQLVAELRRMADALQEAANKTLAAEKSPVAAVARVAA